MAAGSVQSKAFLAGRTRQTGSDAHQLQLAVHRASSQEGELIGR